MYKEYLISLKSPDKAKQRHGEKLTSLINKKTIRYHLNKLVKENNILPEERKPLVIVKHVLKILFWATIYLAFSYLTITSSFEVIEQYYDDQTTTNMKAIINNNVTYLPNMTICFKSNAAELFNINATSNFYYTSAWSRFFNETISPEDIFQVNEGQVYDDEIYLSLFKYLGMIYEAERAWESGLKQISTFHSEESDDWIALKEVLVSNIERFNITLDQLKSVLAGKLCSLPNKWFSEKSLLEMAYETSNKTECVARNKISFIGMDTICFRLIGYQNTLRPFGTTKKIYLDLYDDGTSDQIWYQEFTVDLGSESRSTPRRATTRNETHAYYYNHFTGVVSVDIDIGVKALYRKLSYVNGDLQCSSDTSREECENKCLRGWIRANCHCSAITFNLTADTSHYYNCTVDDYSICLKKYAENATYSCINKCVPLCEQWHYEYTIQPTPPIRAVKSRIEIGLKTFDYVIIEEVFSWPSFEEFIGALGGALGIWLGLDFVIIIEFIIKIVTQLSKKILLRNARNSEEDKQEESSNIKQRGKTVKNGISPSNETGSRVVVHQKKHMKNENELVGISIRQINESEKERTSRKKRKNNALKEKHVQQKRKGLNNSRVESEILEEEMKNIDAHNRRLRNQKVDIIDNIDAVQDESTAQANHSSTRSWFFEKMLVLFLNDDASTNKPALFLRLVEKLFWATIYSIGSVFTIVWCVQLINLHSADEAVYIPSLIKNRTVSFPPSLFCISLHNYRHYERLDNICNDLMEYFDKPNFDRASFIQISNETAWPKPVVNIGLLYFSILAAFETKYTDVSLTSEYERQLDYFGGYKNTLLGKELEKSVNDILLPKLLEWNITTNELRQKLGAELARMAELKISFTNSNGTIDIVEEAFFYTATITYYFFCYDLSFEVSFIDPDDTLEFSMKQQDFPVEYTLGPGYIVLSDLLLVNNMDMNSFNYEMSAFGYTNFHLLQNALIKTFISIVSLSTSRPEAKGVKYCSPNTTISYCRAQCRIELIKKVCNCSPTYWAMMVQSTSGLDECTFDRYMGCQNFNRNDEIECKDSCLPSCTATYFRSVSYQESSASRYTAAIRFSVTDNIYASIDEKSTFTLPQMLNKVQFDT